MADNSTTDGFEQQVDEAFGQVASSLGVDVETFDPIRSLFDGLVATLQETEAENEQLREDIDRECGARASLQKDVSEMKERVDSSASESADQSAESAPREESMTPMERIIRMGENAVTKNLTPSDRRGKAIAEHFSSWASKAPNGIVVKENLRNLLETATGEKLAWKQVHRACRALADLTKGAIAFRKTERFGWVLIAQPDDHRYRSLSAAEG
jgi:hypothetical protein